MQKYFFYIILLLVWSQIANSQIPSNGLVGYYPFHGNAYDGSGNNNNGTVNGATLTTDRFGIAQEAYSFNGTNNYIDIGDVDVLNPHLNSMTVVAWVKTTSSAHFRMYSKGTHGGTQPGYTLMQYSGTSRATLLVGVGGHEHAIISDSPITDGSWHCIVGLIRRSDTLDMWVDGVKQRGDPIIQGKTIGNHATTDIGTGTLNAGIGASPSYYGYLSYNEFFNGQLDDIRIYNRVLTESEIMALYYEGGWQGGSIAGIVFNDRDGDGIKDSGEEGIPGWKLYISGSGIDSTTTDSLGSYTFADLVPGNYTVSESLQAMWQQTLPTGGTYSITVRENLDTSGIDFGNLQLFKINSSAGDHGMISPSGNIIVANGQDTVFAFAPSTGYHVDSVLIDGIKVDSIEGYTFSNVTENHTIRVTFVINTYRLTTTAVHGTVTRIPDLERYDSNTTVQLIPIPDDGYYFEAWSGDTASTEDTLLLVMNKNQSVTANFNQYSSISGVVFFDLNRNTMKESGEPGSVGWTIGLFSIAKNRQIDSTTTDENGSYLFDSLSAETLLIIVKPRNQWIVTTGNAYTVHLASGMHESVDIGVVFLLQYPVTSGWNMLSLPVGNEGMPRMELFPDAVSNIFMFEAGYVPCDTIKQGKGYWAKFSASDSITVAGIPLICDTIPVKAGWNMIGSISYPVATDSIGTIETSVASLFFGFSNGYEIVTDIEPGKAYWVKVDQDGYIILRRETFE